MDAAREHYEAALLVHREVEDRRTEGIVLGNLGILHRQLGDSSLSQSYYEAALSLHREVGDLRFEGTVLGNLGILYLEQGQPARALECYEAALMVHRETRDRRQEGVVLGNLGILHKQNGRMSTAQEHFEAALIIHRELENRQHEGFVLGHLGETLFALGDQAGSEKLLLQGSALLRELNAKRPLCELFLTRGRLALQSGEWESAREVIAEARALAITLSITPDSGTGRDLAALQEALAAGPS